MQTDTYHQLSRTTVVLHWLVSLFIVILLAVGIYMAETETRSLYPLHKSFGVLILFLVIPRIWWRMKNGWPVPVGQYPVHEQLLSKVTHWILLLGTLLMPISGILMSVIGGKGLAVFGLTLAAANPDPADPTKTLAYNGEWAGFFHESHEVIGYLLIAAIVLHVIGALKHHIVDKDGTLMRIKGMKV